MNSFFENPLMLIALAAAALPIIIEILFRKRKRQVQLPTLRFLLKSQEQQKVKNQDKILLILRTILLALLALCLARPLIRHGVVGDVSQRKIIILFDGSASMNQQVGVTTSFGLGLKKASSMIRELPEGSSITAVVLSDQADVIIDDEKDLFLAASKIESVRSSLGALSIAEGIDWINKYIAEKKLNSPEVYIFSDFQKYTWKQASKDNRQPSQALQDLNKATSDVFLVDVGGEGAFNIIVESLSPSEWVLTAGNPVTFNVTLKIVGKPPSDFKGNISFIVNGEKKDLREFDSKESHSFQFDYLFPRSGEFIVEVLAEGDEHAVDNQRLYLCHVPDDHKVLVLDDSAETENEASSILQLAIAPPNVPGMAKASRFETKVVPSGKISYENLESYSAVFVRDFSGVTEGVAKKLEKYVREGGAVCFFVGPLLNAYEYNQFFYKDGAGILPRKIAAKQVADEKGAYPLYGQSTHPALTELASRKGDKDGNFQEYLTFEGQGANDVVLQLSNEIPAILEKSFGKGKCMLVNTTVNMDWSSLSLTAEYPVLIQEVLRYIIGNPDRAVNLTTGDTMEQNVYISNQHLLLRYPDGKKARLKPEEGEDKNELKVRFYRTNQQGLYQFDGVMDGVLKRKKFIVNADAQEGDLTRLSEGDAKDSFGGANWKWIRPEISLEEFVSKLNSVTELAGFLLWLLIATITFESFLAAKYGRRRGGNKA